jgi:YHS domain-containing protein
VVGGSADAVEQPRAHLGDKTYCPVSGVVFQVRDASIKRAVDGKTLYFCCEGCAGYFDAHRERVTAARGLRELPAPAR